MPHACTPTKPSTGRVSRFLGVFQRSQTHLCETPHDTTAYCGAPIAQVDSTPSNCHRARYGPVHRECEAACRKKHGDLP